MKSLYMKYKVEDNGKIISYICHDNNNIIIIKNKKDLLKFNFVNVKVTQNFRIIGNVETISKNKANSLYKLLYHGGNIKGKIIPKSDEFCDFGVGFYTTDYIDYAEYNAIATSGYLYNLFVDFENLRIFDFKKDYRLWALYTAYNREKNNFKDKTELIKIFNNINSNDVVLGLIADDRSQYAFGRFILNAMTDKCLIACLKYFNLGCQYTFKTYEACNKIKILSKEKLNDLAVKRIIHDKNMRVGTSKDIVDKLEEEYAGKGKTFRQILKEYN